MKTVFSFALMLSFWLLMTGCKKTELTGEYEVYQGTWVSAYSVLELNENGRGSFFEQFAASKRSVSGRVIISGNQLKIASTFASKNFHIDIPPAENENDEGDMVWVMRLDGLDFFRD